MGRDVGGGGGLGAPGQKVITHETVKEQLKRVLHTVFWMTLFSMAILAMSFFDLVLWGPMLGVVAGAVMIVAVIRYRVLPVVHERTGQGQAVAVAVCVLALVIWGWAGHNLMLSLWPPYRLTWPLWVKALVECSTVILRVAAGWGVWGMWSELVDPYGPTPPREAIARDKTIKPWDPETRGGQIGQTEELVSRVLYLPTIVTERSNGHARTENRILLRAPSSRPEGLYQYASALASGRAFVSWEGGRSGPGAQQYGYSGTEFEDWRDSAEQAGLVFKRSGKNQGYELTDKGVFHFQRIGERALQAAAFTLQE